MGVGVRVCVAARERHGWDGAEASGKNEPGPVEYARASDVSDASDQAAR